MEKTSGDAWQLSPKATQLHRSAMESLNIKDRASFAQILDQYKKSKNIQRLVQSLNEICCTPQQREEIYPLLRAFIPRAHRERFDYECSRPRSAYGRRYNTYSARKQAKYYHTTRSLPEDYRASPSLYSGRESPVKSPPRIFGTRSKGKERKPIATKVFQLERDQITRGFGFSIRGGAEYNVGLFVSSIDEDSVAENAGLCLGDQILEVNQTDFNNLSHQEAVEIIKQAETLQLLVRSVGKIPGTFKSSSSYRWIDPKGNEVSPPPEFAKANLRSGMNKSEMRLLEGDDERKVNLFVADGAELGLKIRGGSEYGLGIFIASVDRNSGAERAGFQVGDQILDVNGKSFLDITHHEAVEVLTSSQHMVIKLKDIGVLPHGKKIQDETRWIKEPQNRNSSRPSSADSNKNTSLQKKTPSFYEPMGSSQLTHHSIVDHSDEILEIKARQVLPSNELQAFAFYLNEYRITRLSLATFLSVLSDLFKTPAQQSLFQEIRSAILPRDLSKFHEWMVNREKEIEARQYDMRQAKYDRQSLNSYKSSDSSTNSWLGLFEAVGQEQKSKNIEKQDQLGTLREPSKDQQNISRKNRGATSHAGRTQRSMTFEDFPPPPAFVSNSETISERHKVVRNQNGFNTSTSSPTDSLPEPPTWIHQTEDSAIRVTARFEPTVAPLSSQQKFLGDNCHASSKHWNISTGLSVHEVNEETEDPLYAAVDTFDEIRLRKAASPVRNSHGTVHGVVNNVDREDRLYTAVDPKDSSELSQNCVFLQNDRQDRLCPQVNVWDADGSSNSPAPAAAQDMENHAGKQKDKTATQMNVVKNDGLPLYACVDKTTKRKNTFPSSNTKTLPSEDFDIPPPVPERRYTESEATTLLGRNRQSVQDFGLDECKDLSQTFNTNTLDSRKDNTTSAKYLPDFNRNSVESSHDMVSRTETNSEIFPGQIREMSEGPVVNGSRNGESKPRVKKKKSRSNITQQEELNHGSKTFVVELTKHSSNLGLAITGGTDTSSKEIRIKSVKTGDTVAGSCPLLQPGQILLGVDERSLQNVTSGIAAMAIRQAFNSDKEILKFIIENDS